MTEGVFGNLTGDPYSWAEEWLKIYSIRYPDGVAIDEEWMMGWFANAIVYGETEYAKADDYLRQTLGPDWRIKVNLWWEDTYLNPYRDEE